MSVGRSGLLGSAVSGWLFGTEVMGKLTFLESGVNRDLRASLAPEAHQRFQRHQHLSVYSRLRKSWSEKVGGTLLHLEVTNPRNLKVGRSKGNSGGGQKKPM